MSERGRPSGYSEEVAQAICAELAIGRSLKSVCADPAMPALRTVFAWLATHESFQHLYARAKEASADALVEDILDISDDGLNDTYVDDNGNERTNTDVIQRSKLRVDTRKWIASKLKPKKYGDRVQTEVSTAPDLSATLAALIDRLPQ